MFFAGKLFDATGSYDIPFFINGALLWAAALMFWFFAKFSCWKEKSGTEESTLSDGDIAIGNGIVAAESRDVKENPVANRYQPFPTGNDDIQLELTAGSRDVKEKPVATRYQPVPTGNDDIQLDV